MEFLSGFAIGLLGSLHCIGMCGPIALALPANDGTIPQNSKFSSSRSLSFFFGRFLYNFGRILTYTFLGFLFGLLGNRLQLYGLQQIISVSFGIIILAGLLLPAKWKKLIYGFPLFVYISGFWKRAFSRFLKGGSFRSLFIVGIVNGFLPCGLVYIAVAAAIAAGGLLSAFLLMFGFGVGTLPAMFAASVATSFLGLSFRFKVRRFVPVFLAVIAVLFILRGMNLGIPYISPKFQPASPEQIIVPSGECH